MVDLSVSGGQKGGTNRYNQRVGTPNSKVEQAFSVEEGGGVNSNVAAPDGAAALDAPERVDSAKKVETEAPVKKEDISRQLNKSDIANELIKLQKPLTEHSRNIITTILENGLAASGENYENIMKLLKGKKDSTSVESAVLALTKGLGESPESVDLLTKFLSENPQMAKQMKELSGKLNMFSSMLGQSAEFFSKGLMTGVMSIIAELDDTLKKATKKSTDQNVAKAELLSRKDLFTNFKAFFELLGGISKKLTASGHLDSPKGKLLNGNLGSLKHTITGFLNNLSSQEILSKPPEHLLVGTDTYAYWQIPNPMLQVPANIDLLIKREKKDKKSINHQKTTLVLKFETEDLGMIAITLEIEDQQVVTIFHSEDMDMRRSMAGLQKDLQDRFLALNYHIVGFRFLSKLPDIKKLLMPKMDLGGLSRISAEA